MKTFDPIQSDRAAARRHHFANNGTLAAWRGRPCVIANKRADKNKKHCRKNGED